MCCDGNWQRMNERSSGSGGGDGGATLAAIGEKRQMKIEKANINKITMGTKMIMFESFFCGTNIDWKTVCSYL